jgi:hypothetical protein
MMQDPAKKWTQRNLKEASSDARGQNYHKSENFVDDMMRLKDSVFKAQSIRRDIHSYAMGNDAIDNKTYDHISNERSCFRSICSSVSIQCVNYLIDDVFKLKIGKTKTDKLLSMLRATEKFIEQVRHNPHNDTDDKLIIKKHVEWKRS